MNNEDDEDEEEMICLLRGSDNEDGNPAATASRLGRGSGGGCAGATPPGAPAASTSMVGANRKSTFPATPATPAAAASASRFHHQPRGGSGVDRPLRRTPGPPTASVARQAKHRRTPGAGYSHNAKQSTDLGRSHAKTPVMSGGSNRIGKTPHKQLQLSSSSLITPSNKPLGSSLEPPNVNVTNSSNRTNIVDENNRNHRQLYTPAHFTLAKNADLNMENRPDAFSPATIRMTDSLEKILTDDDDYLEARQRALIQQKQQLQQPQAEKHQKIMTSGSGTNVVFDSYSEAESSYVDRGTFRRIQSTGSSSEDEGDSNKKDTKEMKENDGRGNNTTAGEGGYLHEEDEEEAEISQINLDEDGDNEPPSFPNGDGDDNSKSSTSRPQPLNLSGGAFKPPTKKQSLKSVANSKAERAAAMGAKPGLLHTPKPQRVQGSGGGHHPSQGQGGMYYPPPSSQQQQHGYYGGHPMMFPHEPQPASHQFQYSHQQLHQFVQQQQFHHPPQNFHFPPVSSPQNAMFGSIPPTVVSPLTIPPDYSHGAYHPHSQANTYPHQQQHSLQTLAPEFGSAGQVLGMSGDHWSWSESTFAHSQHHGMHHNQLGMGIPAPGHASPDFSFQSGEVSPFTIPMPHHHFSAAAQHHALVNNYPHHPPPPNHHQYSTNGTAPIAPHLSEPVRKLMQTKESGRQTPSNNCKLASPLSLSPSKQQHSSPLGGGKRQPPRKDSVSSSINSGSGASGAFSGGEDQQQGGGCGLPTAVNPAAIPSPTSASTSSTSVLKQTFPGLAHSASSDEQECNDWFYPSNDSKNVSHSTADSEGGSSASLYFGYPKQQHKITPSSVQVRKLQGKRGTAKHQQQQQLRAERGKIQYQHLAPPYPDTTRGKQGGGTRGGGNGADDEGRQRRSAGEQPVMESPTERQAYKEFGRAFRQKENESLDAARDYALACLDAESNPETYLPPATHWRVYLELADVAKRSNRVDDARGYYRRACRLQPRASQGWLEHSKLEEECGHLSRCAGILQEGLQHCVTNENLLIRAVKFYERVGKLDQARRLLSRLKHLSIDKSWKTMLEGALLEARAGRYLMAREVLKYLTHNVPWYGPLYLAHTKLERDYGSSSEAFSIVERGLKELPRYGPLYFQAFRLLEKCDLSQKAYSLPRTMKMVSRADNISRELLWKVHLEAAQMQERAATLAVEDNPKIEFRTALQAARRSYAKAIMLCPPNLSWKIWLASGRTEVTCGNTKGARDLFLRAYESVSEKGRSTVLLECARLEEFNGDLALSRSILCKARNLFGKSDWKVWLSSVNLECRCGLRERAIAFAQEALKMHRGTGRLWAALIQLFHENGELDQTKALKSALRAVPKSGEVWCEGARIHLNPFAPVFDLQAASRCLYFAARFTPQYGDSFLEQLRLDMIDQWLTPLAIPFITSMERSFLTRGHMKIEDAHIFITEHTKKAADGVKTQFNNTNIVKRDVLDTSDLELRCSSADPNYGHLWFQCRNSPIDTAKEVIAQAKGAMAEFIVDYSYLYISAIVRRAGVLMFINHQYGKTTTHSAHPSTPSGVFYKRPSCTHPCEWDTTAERQLRLAPSLSDMLSTCNLGSIFTTGCGGNIHEWDILSLLERRRILFGSDSLLS